MKKQVIGIGKVNTMQYSCDMGTRHVQVLAPNRRKLSKRVVDNTARAHVGEWDTCKLISATGNVLDRAVSIPESKMQEAS